MKHKNIIYISGDDSFMIEKDLHWLEENFEKKYGAMNIEHHNLADWKNFHTETLLSADLFSEKKLFIFRGTQPKEDARKKEKDMSRIEYVIEKIHDKIPEETIIIFAFLGQEEKKLIKWLKKNATERLHTFSWNLSQWEKRSSLPKTEIQKILNLYQKYESLRDKYDSNPLLAHDISNSLQMAELWYENNGKLDTETLESLVHAYEGGALFNFMDSILTKNIVGSLQKFERFKGYQSGEFYRFLGGLLTSLRNSTYIITLRELGKSQKEISETLPIHPFVIQKSYKSPLTKKEITDFYKKILSAKIAYQRGKGMKKNELGLLFEIELGLINLKK